jgi:hypothetical protein
MTHFLRIELRNVEALVEVVNDANSDIVCLHVGGKRCTTTRATLRRFPDSMLAIMFSGRYPLDYLENGDIYLVCRYIDFLCICFASRPWLVFPKCL